MSYINEYNSLNNYKDNGIQSNYLRNNSEGHFKRNKFLNYDKIYNQFLTSPYPPMYYQRAKIITPYHYQIKKNEIRDTENNFQNFQSNENNNLKLINPRKINDYNVNTKINSNNNINYLNTNPSLEEEEKIINLNTSRNKNYHFKGNEELNKSQNINKKYEIFNNSNNKYEIDIPKSFGISNQKELPNQNNQKDNFNIRDLDNNRFVLSYDDRKKNYNNGYVSPIITQIARKNYLGNNPYSDKEQDLGPTMLKNNPILYPIDTYKFDFNRYIKDEYLNKYI